MIKQMHRERERERERERGREGEREGGDPMKIVLERDTLRNGRMQFRILALLCFFFRASFRSVSVSVSASVAQFCDSASRNRKFGFDPKIGICCKRPEVRQDGVEFFRFTDVRNFCEVTKKTTKTTLTKKTTKTTTTFPELSASREML